MSERRRMSRARATAAPEREVQPGVAARLRWGGFAIIDDPFPQAQFRREYVGEWVERPRGAGVGRRAVERTGRVLVAWLIGRWRR